MAENTIEIKVKVDMSELDEAVEKAQYMYALVHSDLPSEELLQKLYELREELNYEEVY